MKRFISFLLVVMMLLSIIPTAFATTNYTNGTQVQYNAEADNDNDGQPDHSEAWTVTVPALLEPGSEGNVVAQGTWASNRKLVVTADATVTLANSINANDTKTLDIGFDGIELAGSNTAAVSATEAVGVADIENALFGTWSGTFYYDVEMVDAVEMIAFKIVYPSRGYEDEFQAEKNMTWAEWVISEYNTEGFTIDNNDYIKHPNNGEVYATTYDAGHVQPHCYSSEIITQTSYECKFSGRV